MYLVRLTNRTKEPVEIFDIEVAPGQTLEYWGTPDEIDFKSFIVKTPRYSDLDVCPECEQEYLELDDSGYICEGCGYKPDWVFMVRRWRWKAGQKIK